MAGYKVISAYFILETACTYQIQVIGPLSLKPIRCEGCTVEITPGAELTSNALFWDISGAWVNLSS